ncbi:MAG: type II toxin-antitoxin system prevent-host-death family antitoxin [Deltaproteobacteria bacterium]|nr:type II toxin-antitoxin system prevent-host-death family antitoxin [Deltaproteobacteria bacterium]
MDRIINAKDLRASLPEIVRRVRRGERFTVLYRSRPAFRMVPVDEAGAAPGPLDADPLFRAPALGRSRDGLTAADHDQVLYGVRR